MMTSVQGVGLHWVERGRGRPLVLLHGLGDAHLTWKELAPAFADRRVLMLDLPGHGLSDRPDAPYCLEWYSTIVGGWLDQLGLEELDLVGHSFGGGVAQQLLLSHAERVGRVALLAPGGHGDEVVLGLRLLQLPGVDRLIQPLIGLGTRVSFASSLGGRVAPADLRTLGWMNSAPGTARALVRSARAVVGWGGQTVNVGEQSRRIGNLPSMPPTLICWGDRDPVLPVRQAHTAAATLRNAQLEILSGCGHFPHIERTRKVACLLAHHLDRSYARRVIVAVPAAAKEPQRWWQRVWGALRGAAARLVRSPSIERSSPQSCTPNDGSAQRARG